jgi:hypothetical protein
MPIKSLICGSAITPLSSYEKTGGVSLAGIFSGWEEISGG